MEFSSGIVLSGGSSSRFGEEKALVKIRGKVLIQYVLDVIMPLVDEIIVVVKTPEQGKRIGEACKGSFTLVFDESEVRSPIAGALTGMKKAMGEVSILLSCDTPLLSSNVIKFLLDLSSSYDAVIPKWPNGNIEPLQSVYNTAKTCAAAAEAIEAQQLRVYDAIKRLNNVLYISTDVLRQLDPDLHTFENVNVPNDVKRVETLLRSTSY